MTLDLARPRRRRRPSLTPMIDVVFLLLVFFMLVARFGGEGAVLLDAGGGGATDGAPRLVEVRPDGLALNGLAMSPASLLEALDRGRGDVTVLRGRDGATLQDLVAAIDLLRGAGHDRLAVVE